MTLHTAQGRIGLAAAIALAALISAPAAQAQVAQRVAKDPVTGQLGAPTQDQAKALESMGQTRSSLAGARGLRTGKLNPQPIQHADGSIEQELTEDTQIFSVVTRNPDGTLDNECVTGKAAADALVFNKKSISTSKAGKEHNHDLK